MTENEQKQHESFRKAFEAMIPIMDSKKLITDLNFRDILKTPNKDFRKSNLSYIPSEGYDSD